MFSLLKRGGLERGPQTAHRDTIPKHTIDKKAFRREFEQFERALADRPYPSDQGFPLLLIRQDKTAMAEFEALVTSCVELVSKYGSDREALTEIDRSINWYMKGGALRTHFKSQINDRVNAKLDALETTTKHVLEQIQSLVAQF